MMSRSQERIAPKRASIVGPFVVALGLALFAMAPACGESADPAASRISSFYAALLDTMKQAKQLGLKGRYDKLSPVLSKTYDLASMSRIAVGQSWSTLSPAQQLGIVNAFTRMTTATYASRFDGFSGEQFEILQTADQPNGDKIVRTSIVQSNGKTVALNYLMRKTGTDWKIIDVYLDGTISELASRRAEFGSILKSGGPDALLGSLVKQGDKLLAGT
jgi:phospholipid transport system substrate-binding protein